MEKKYIKKKTNFALYKTTFLCVNSSKKPAHTHTYTLLLLCEIFTPRKTLAKEFFKVMPIIYTQNQN